MPSRNKVPNAAELVSRSLNWTRPLSPCERSAMVNALTPLLPPPASIRLMMNKSLRGGGAESSRNTDYGFQPVRRDGPKKEPPFPAAFEVDNREASNRVTGATRCPNRDVLSHIRESLIDRKRGIFLKSRLPCRPMA